MRRPTGRASTSSTGSSGFSVKRRADLAGGQAIGDAGFAEFDVAGELDDHTRSGVIDDEVDREQGVEGVVFLGGEIHGAGEGVVEQRRGRFDRADLRGVRAQVRLGFFVSGFSTSVVKRVFPPGSVTATDSGTLPGGWLVTVTPAPGPVSAGGRR